MQNMKMTDMLEINDGPLQNAGHENTGPKNAGHVIDEQRVET